MTALVYNNQTLPTFSNTSLTTPATSMAASLYSTPLDIRNSNTFAMQFIYTGTPTGNLYIMGSLDGIHYNIQLATSALSGSAGNFEFDLSATAGLITSCGWVQGQYIFTSGTGTLTTVTGVSKYQSGY